MRDGNKVTLPITISKDSFILDLNYYGVKKENDTKLSEKNVSAIHIGVQAHLKLMKDLDEQIVYLSFCKSSRILAAKCVAKMWQDPIKTLHGGGDIEEEIKAHRELFSQFEDIFEEYDLKIVSAKKGYKIMMVALEKTKTRSDEVTECLPVVVDENQNKTDVDETVAQGIFRGIQTHSEIMKDLEKRILDLSFCKECRIYAAQRVALIMLNDDKLPFEKCFPILVQQELRNRYSGKNRLAEALTILSEYNLKPARFSIHNSTVFPSLWTIK